MKTIKVNENTYKILIKTSNLTGIGISEIVQNLVKDKVNDRIKAAVELQEQLKDFVTLGRTQSRLTQKNNNDMIVVYF